MDDEDESTVYGIKHRFFSRRHTKGLKSARMRDALYNLPKEIAKI